MPFQQADNIYTTLLKQIPKQALDLLCLAWQHGHFSYQTKAKQKKYHQENKEILLSLAQELLEKDFSSLKTRLLTWGHYTSTRRICQLAKYQWV